MSPPTPPPPSFMTSMVRHLSPRHRTCWLFSFEFFARLASPRSDMWTTITWSSCAATTAAYLVAGIVMAFSLGARKGRGVFTLVAPFAAATCGFLHAFVVSGTAGMSWLLCCAVLCCAVLCCAVLCCAVLCCAVLCCAVLCCAASWCVMLVTDALTFPVG